MVDSEFVREAGSEGEQLDADPAQVPGTVALEPER
jgi:hypothetical protein